MAIRYRPTDHVRLYAVWYGMKQRCYNESHKRYKNYGGRGISIVDEWRNSFDTFAKWAFETGYDENADYGKCTIDRIDPNGNYEPDNCRWITLKEQSLNRTNNVYLEFNGRKMTLSEWSEETGISSFTLRARMVRGLTAEKTLTTPPKKQAVKQEKNPQINSSWLTYSPTEVARILGKELDEVDTLLESGRIPAMKINSTWIIPRESFDEAIENGSLQLR